LVAVLEKMFAANAKQGIVSANVVPGLLREFNTDISVSPEDLTEVTSDYDGNFMRFFLIVILFTDQWPTIENILKE
jgi:hypothetical protein